MRQTHDNTSPATRPPPPFVCMHGLTSNPPTASACLLGASGQESGLFETIELTDAMSEPKVTTAAMNGEEMVAIAEGLEVVPSLLPNPELPHLKRALGWISLTSMGVGATIGAGIFVMSVQQTLQPSYSYALEPALPSTAAPNRGLQDLVLRQEALLVSSLYIARFALSQDRHRCAQHCRAGHQHQFRGRRHRVRILRPLLCLCHAACKAHSQSGGTVAKCRVSTAIYRDSLALLLSLVVQAEFAALAPSAGSAYAYTRATMGQFLAFMLGWDLVLEYTVAGSSDAAAGAQEEVWAAQSVLRERKFQCLISAATLMFPFFSILQIRCCGCTELVAVFQRVSGTLRNANSGYHFNSSVFSEKLHGGPAAHAMLICTTQPCGCYVFHSRSSLWIRHVDPAGDLFAGRAGPAGPAHLPAGHVAAGVRRARVGTV